MSLSVRVRALKLATLALLLLALLPAASTAHAAARTAALTTANGMLVDPAIAQVWHETDGSSDDGSAARSWLWGPGALSTSVEHYQDSPTGVRTMVYFDKGRLDILNPDGDANSPWFVSGAALVTEMLSGQIQFGAQEFVTRAAPAIAIVGDPGTTALTYAQLAPFAYIGPRPLANAPAAPASLALPGSRIGERLTALLSPDGRVEPDAVPDASVVIGAYDDVTGHNVASPFWDWSASQRYPAAWLLGRPLTEPYWLDATVAGTPKRVLMQAFERRILTWTPGNAAGWQVESANVGQHYRAWRGLAQPSDAGLVSLASLEPSGEEVVAAATAAGVDPFLLSALARVASHGDPVATLPNGGQGLLGVRADMPEAAGDFLTDPTLNAQAGAQELARLATAAPQPLDWRAVLATYYGGANPNWNDPNLANTVNGTLGAWGELLSTHPMRAPEAAPVAESLALVDSGQAAFYAPSYGVDWWERTLANYANWGGAVPGATADPDGYYCVHPGYIPGQRLRLAANGVTLDCTIGDTVQTYDVAQWTASWAIELNYPAFVALGLNGANHVEVYALGS
jgi:hypothetical protein